MSQHDNQSPNSPNSPNSPSSSTPSGQFSGDDLEFSPFMFDPNPEATSTASGQFSTADMEFEPFMFNQGESFGMAGASGMAGHTSPLHQSALPTAAPKASGPLPSGPLPSVSEQSVPVPTPAPAPFAGSEVPLPSYLKPSPTAPESLPAMPSMPTPMTSASPWSSPAFQPSAPAEPQPNWANNLSAAPPDPIQQIGRQNTTTTPSLADSKPPTGPISASSMPPRQITPLQTPPSPAPAPGPAPAPAPSHPISTPNLLSGMGMGGRSRGNTGPLSSSVPNASWSDSSLASIEDFSSVLIAMQAGKRLRQSGPIGGSANPGQASTSPVAATATVPAPAPASAPMQSDAQPWQPAMPDWANQAVASLTETVPVTQPESEATPTWASARWEPQLPEETTQAWSSSPQSEPQGSASQIEAGMLPPWSMNPPSQPPDATSWTGAQPQSAATPSMNSSAVSAWPTLPPMPAPTVPSAPETSSIPTPSVTDTARSELAAIREKPIDDMLGGLEPGVADLFKNMSPAITEGSVTGDDLQFEGFMFNQGMPAPLPMLPSIDSTAMGNLPTDMGPVFDPSEYINPTESEETHEYADIEPSAMHGLSSSSPLVGSAEGPLPFWLQEQSTTGYKDMPAPAAEQSAPAAPVPVPAMSEDTSQPPQSSASMMSTNDSAALLGAFGDASSSGSAFSELPPIDPFDFSMLDSETKDEPFGFNTGELSGLMPDDHDPMVVTANLEALADLLGGHAGGNLPDPHVLRQAGLGNVEMVIPATQTQPEPQPVVPAPAPTPEPEAELEPAPTMGSAQSSAITSEAPTQPRIVPVEPVLSREPEPEPTAQGGWMGTVTTNLAMDTLSTLTGGLEGSATPAEMVVEDLDVAPFDFTELDLAVEDEVATGYLDARKSLRGPGTASLEALPEEDAPAHPTHPAMEEIWSAADGDASLFAGDLPGKTVSEQAELHLAHAIPSTPSAPDAPFMDMEPVEPFVPPVQAAEPGSDTPEITSLDMVEQTGPVQAPHMVGMSDFTPMPDGVPEAGVWSGSSGSQPTESSNLAWMVGMSEAQPSLEHVEGQEQEEPVFRARVSSGSWGDYSIPAEFAPTPEPVAEQQVESASSDHDESSMTEDGAMRPWAAAPTIVLDSSAVEASHGPWEGLAASAMAANEPAQPADSQVQFEEEYVPRVAVHGDITTSGPLPSLDGFEDLNNWIERNPHDMGAHMALASAYTQAGDIDTALRVYRRMLRTTNISENVLRMIADELSDLEDQAHQYPRYHQVRGDLLVKQGRRREAIEEYNKMG